MPAKIPVQLAGANEIGQDFLESALTLTLSQYGAAILSKRKLTPRQEIIIRRLDVDREARARITGVIGDRVEGYVYAVEFMDPHTDFWEIEFPPAPDRDEAGDVIYLICSCCGKLDPIRLDEFKLDDFEAAHGVLLYCIQCQAMTRWTQWAGSNTTDDWQPS